MEDRKRLLCEFYNIPANVLDALVLLPHKEERRQACRNAGIDPHIVRTMIDYDRYFEAGKICEELERRKVNLARMTILDFGCLVADYGIYFARKGASILVYDHGEYTRFAAYRFEREGRAIRVTNIPTEYSTLMKGQQLVVFGEVLEHMDDSFEALQACVEAGVEFIFTSCYPFGDKRYFALPGHSKEAQRIQPQCIDLLRKYYQGINIHRKARIWVRYT
jgi:hypothetical protein